MGFANGWIDGPQGPAGAPGAVDAREPARTAVVEKKHARLDSTRARFEAKSSAAHGHFRPHNGIGRLDPGLSADRKMPVLIPTRISGGGRPGSGCTFSVLSGRAGQEIPSVRQAGAPGRRGSTVIEEAQPELPAGRPVLVTGGERSHGRRGTTGVFPPAGRRARRRLAARSLVAGRHKALMIKRQRGKGLFWADRGGHRRDREHLSRYARRLPGTRSRCTRRWRLTYNGPLFEPADTPPWLETWRRWNRRVRCRALHRMAKQGARGWAARFGEPFVPNYRSAPLPPLTATQSRRRPPPPVPKPAPVPAQRCHQRGQQPHKRRRSVSGHTDPGADDASGPRFR